MEAAIVTTEKQQQDAFLIRKIVFIDEQQVPPEEEIDQFEKEATHFVLYDGARPIGAGRFRSVDGVGKIERVCILKEYRGNGAGKLLMEKMIQYAQEVNFSKVKLNSQTHAIPFYEKLGFIVVSEEFMDAGIPHKTMELTF
ncbi:GNAT family N-acetyltransferase [Bacillus kwashiorkori]|uniref:GNAT family N-acetyltransferase n=1 Tax=Bacillus kwashiorkori TaxID=1522318 RepID=UPI0007805310|nr:GNAT family N-acetyltransferase [Bacillus kwashiorkori]